MENAYEKDPCIALLRRSVAEVQAVHNRQRGVIVDYDTELHLHNAVLRRACDIRRNEHVLDIGCGTGLTTREAARSAAMGRVLGVDTSAAMLARPRQLAEAEELHHVSFEEGDAQVHP